MTGAIGELLDELEHRNDGDFLAKRTILTKRNRKLRLDHKRTFALAEADLAQLTQALAEDAPQYRVLDGAIRVAGTGSLGLKRYLLLVTDKNLADTPLLMELKQAHPSSLEPFLSIAQPKWSTLAQRVIAIQKQMQASPLPHLQALNLEGTSYIWRELQPSEDRLKLGAWAKSERQLGETVASMTRLLAQAQLRSISGTADPTTLRSFAQQSAWCKPLLDYAQSYSRQVKHDWQVFRHELGMD